MAAFDDGASSDKLPDREVLTWDGFGEGMRTLAQMVVDSGWVPDLVVAVARGGLLPAGALSYALGTKSIGTLNVEFYTDVAETLPEPVILPPLMDTTALAGKKVLVVDDVADSGKTLKLVMDLIREKGLPAKDAPGGIVPVSEARSCVIFEKSRSIIKPEYVLKRTDKWINFPWSDKPIISLPSN